MKNKERNKALKALEVISDADFEKFLNECPARVQLLVRSGIANWKVILPEWYVSIPTNNK